MKFCIVGSGRCGTTLLQRMVTSHPNIHVINETHFIPKLYELFGLIPQDPQDLLEVVRRTSHITGQNTMVIPNSIGNDFARCDRMTIRQFCDQLGNGLARLQNKDFWGDKTPDYGIFMALIQGIWPKCKFIHIMRHGIDVSTSMSRHPGYRCLVSANELAWPVVSYNHYYKSVEIENHPIPKYFDFWINRVLRIRHEAKRLHSNSYLEIRYEDLCSKTNLVLESLAGFLEIDANRDWTNNCSSLVDYGKFQINARNRDHTILTQSQLDQLVKIGYS